MLLGICSEGLRSSPELLLDVSAARQQLRSQTASHGSKGQKKDRSLRQKRQNSRLPSAKNHVQARDPAWRAQLTANRERESERERQRKKQ